MKKIILIVLLLSVYNIYAQDVSIVKSEIFKDSKKNSSLKYSLEDGNGGLVTIRAFYGGLMGVKLKGYYIQYFDTDLKLINETEFEVDKNYIKNAFVKDNQLHIIEYVTNKKKKEILFNVASADLNTLKFKRREILSLSKENQKKYFGVIIFPFFFSNFSQYDKNHTGEVRMSEKNNFFGINFEINNKNKETHKVFVFNSDFERVYEQQIQKDIKDKYFDYENFDIDDTDGTVYFLGKSFENNSRKTRKKGKTNYHFELYKVNASGQAHVSFKNDDKFINSLEMKKTKNRLICIGFYGEKKEGRINGVGLYDLNTETLEMQSQKFTPFSEQFLTDKYGKNGSYKEYKKKKGIKNIDFKGVYVMDNGDVILNAEEVYITTHTSMSSNGTMNTYSVYHFNDIMSLRMNKDGDMLWSRNINKNQTGFLNSSYTSIPVKADTYFFINSSDRIRKLSANRISFRQTRAKKSNLYVIKINENGDLDFKKLIDDKESKVYYKVNNGNINRESNTVILIGKRKKKSRILKLAI